jgi:hypothetical protein
LDGIGKEEMELTDKEHNLGGRAGRFLDGRRALSPPPGSSSSGGGAVVEGLPPISKPQMRSHSMFSPDAVTMAGIAAKDKEQNMRDINMRRKKSQIYMQMMASDSVNEVHPEKMTDFFKTNFKNIYQEGVTKKDFEQKLFKLTSAEKPTVSVSDLKSRFETKKGDQKKDAAGPSSQSAEEAANAASVPEKKVSLFCFRHNR